MSQKRMSQTHMSQALMFQFQPFAYYLCNFLYVFSTVVSVTLMQVYINHVLRAQLSYTEYTTLTLTNRTTTQHSTARFLVGYTDDPDVDMSDPVLYGDFIVDELELWFRDRNTLLAFGYIDRGVSALVQTGPNIRWPRPVLPPMSLFEYKRQWSVRQTDRQMDVATRHSLLNALIEVY